MGNIIMQFKLHFFLRLFAVINPVSENSSTNINADIHQNQYKYLLRLMMKFVTLQLLLAGIVGIYFCATDFAAYQASVKAYAIKVGVFNLLNYCSF